MQNAEKVEQIARAAIRRWVRMVLHEQGWSAEEWAKRASTSATNITRILALEEFSLPNTDTLARLVRAAGSQPDLLGRPLEPHVSTVPLLAHTQVAQMLRLESTGRIAFLQRMREEFPAQQILFRPSRSGFAVEIETNSLQGRRVGKHDIAIIEPDDFGPGSSGAAVGAIVAGKISAWLFYPPLLVPASEEYDPVALKDIKMLGRIVQAIRRF